MKPVCGVSENNKCERLIRRLKGSNSLIIAFSGGVDSTFLLAAALEALGKDRVIAVTSHSEIHPKRERLDATEMATEMGIRWVPMDGKELESLEFTMNSPRRCYVCKKSLFQKMSKIARDYGIQNIAHGANVDDLSDFRPGFQAAQEEGILSPLIEAGLTKPEIRHFSKELGLPTWNKPPMACLATRIPFGRRITKKALERVDRAETLLLDLGFSMCRVRDLDAGASIEVMPEELKRLNAPDLREKITTTLQAMGFAAVVINPVGYRQGSLNPDESIKSR